MRKTLWIVLLAIPCLATGPRYNFEDSRLNDEFENVYHDIGAGEKAAAIYRGAGPPAFRPKKEGDIYVSTTTAKVYIATSTVSSTSWAIMN